MPRRVEIRIPLIPTGPNQRPSKLRERMALARREREVAKAYAYAVKNRDLVAPFFAGTVKFLVCRPRLLDYDNLVASLKHVQDGIVACFLPEGDGPTAPYKWSYDQMKATKREGQGVIAIIEANE